MFRSGCVAVATLALLSAPVSAQAARIGELERKVRDLEAKVRDAERQRDDAKREQARGQQAAETERRAATQAGDTARREKDSLALKVKELEGKLASAQADAARSGAGDAGTVARLQRERDEQKEIARLLLELARTELLKRPAVKADPKLTEQVEKADAKALIDLSVRLK